MSTVLKTTARLDEAQTDFAARLKQDTDESTALCELTGRQVGSGTPAATLVNALIEAGIAAVKDRAEEVGRARLAEHLKTDAEHQAWRTSRRRRTARRMGNAA